MEKSKNKGMTWMRKLANMFTHSNTKISIGSRTVLLGTSFSPTDEESLIQCQASFLQAFSRLFLFTYRANFIPIQNGDRRFKCDAGWGCMIRVGQMLMAECLTRHFENTAFEAILPHFSDLNPYAMFSIQSLVHEGTKTFSKPPGTWFNPSQACHLMVNTNQIPGLECLVFMDRVIYKDQVYTAAGAAAGEQWQKSVLIMVPMMLGLSSINPQYYDTMRICLSFGSSVGIMGGKPRSALYLPGYQGNNFLFLDPHNCQVASDDPKTYHSTEPQNISVKDLDSSMAAGFYFKNLESFEAFESQFELFESAINGVVVIEENTPHWDLEEIEDQIIQIEDEDFIVL